MNSDATNARTRQEAARTSGPACMSAGSGQAHSEGRAGLHVAVHADRAMERIHDSLDDGKAQARASGSSGAGRIGLEEAIKHVRCDFRCHAGRAIGDLHAHLIAFGDQSHDNRGLRMGDGVGQQVVDHLAKPHLLREHHRQPRFQIHGEIDLTIGDLHAGSIHLL